MKSSSHSMPWDLMYNLNWLRALSIRSKNVLNVLFRSRSAPLDMLVLFLRKISNVRIELSKKPSSFVLNTLRPLLVK